MNLIMRTKSYDNNQFKVVSHSPSSDLDNICENIKNNTNLSGLTHIEFGKLRKIEMNQIENSINAKMEIFEHTLIEISNSLSKDLYDSVEQKWQYSLSTERQIKETTLAQVMVEFDKITMTKEIKKCTGKLVPKYRAFSILQNNIEDVVKKTTQIWKSLYGLTTPKVIEQTPIEVGQEKDEQQQVTKVTIVDTETITHEEGTETNEDAQATTKVEQQT